jgi:hypothetical protein
MQDKYKLCSVCFLQLLYIYALYVDALNFFHMHAQGKTHYPSHHMIKWIIVHTSTTEKHSFIPVGNPHLYRVSNPYKPSDINEVEHFYRVRYPLQMPHICTGWNYHPIQMWLLRSPFCPSFLPFLLFSHLISYTSLDFSRIDHSLVPLQTNFTKNTITHHIFHMFTSQSHNPISYKSLENINFTFTSTHLTISQTHKTIDLSLKNTSHKEKQHLTDTHRRPPD